MAKHITSDRRNASIIASGDVTVSQVFLRGVIVLSISEI